MYDITNPMLRYNPSMKINENWQFRYNNIKVNSILDNSINKVYEWIIHDISHPMIPHLNKIISGHTKLNDHLFKLKLVESSKCIPCDEPETTFHYIFHCERFTRVRRQYINDIKNILNRRTIISLADVSSSTIIGQRHDLSNVINLKLLRAFLNFIQMTGRFT